MRLEVARDVAAVRSHYEEMIPLLIVILGVLKYLRCFAVKFWLRYIKEIWWRTK